MAHAFVRLRMLHPMIALVTGVFVLATAGFVRMTRTGRAKSLARLATILFVVQFCAGLLNVTLLAPVAMQGGRHVARAIEDRIAGRATRAFAYRDPGTMATIGRNAAVAELRGGFRARGFLAWLLWLVLHLVQLIGVRNRLHVLISWAWNYFTWDRSARLILEVDAVDRNVAKRTDAQA